MLASNRVWNRILDRMLELLPDEPADSKRFDDIVDTELEPESPKAESPKAESPRAEPGESLIPGSGVRETGTGSGLRAAS